MGQLAFSKLSALAVMGFKAFLDFLIRKATFGDHFHQKMEMVAHQAKAQYFSKIQCCKSFNQPQQLEPIEN